MLVSIAVFSLIPKLWPFYFKAGSRVVLLPLIAGISYEFLKWSAKNDGHPLVRMIIAPGLALQRLTTREPDDQPARSGHPLHERGTGSERRVCGRPLVV